MGQGGSEQGMNQLLLPLPSGLLHLDPWGSLFTTASPSRPSAGTTSGLSRLTRKKMLKDLSEHIVMKRFWQASAWCKAGFSLRARAGGVGKHLLNRQKQ